MRCSILVMPASSPVLVARLPVSVLIKVDLPTLGMPQISTRIGLTMLPRSGARAWQASINLRAGAVSLWDGGTLLPRDRIQLEVAPEEFDHVSVFNLDAKGSPALLYQGPVKPYSRQVLPKAWELDAAGDAEHIVVMFLPKSPDGEIGRRAIFRL